MGATTLELDIGITADRVVIVNHDRRISRRLFMDTTPLVVGDPLFPYAGRRIVDLTKAQIDTIRVRPVGLATDGGSRGINNLGPAAETPDSPPVSTLEEVFGLCRRNSEPVRLNIEAKVDPTRPADTLDPESFAAITLKAIETFKGPTAAILSCFDWRVLIAARSASSSLPLVALVACSTPGRQFPDTVWTAGVDVAARPFFGNLAAAARHIGACVLAPNWRDVTESMVRSAHREGVQIVPWTVNRQAAMRRLTDLGVDGIITDYPARLQAVLTGRRIALQSSSLILAGA